jgi:uncharacterized protein (DUF58 family)
MPSSSYRFLPPRTLAALGDLELAARTVVDGLMYGVHPSRLPGPGLEFSQYRSYQPGDDPRRVDWKLYARSDRYFVREAEIETSITVRLLVDASASMTQEDSGLSKFDYARFAAASLALLAHRQGDAVGLWAVSDGAIHTTPPQRHHHHLNQILHNLETLQAGGSWPSWRRLESLLTTGGRGLVVILSDLHERSREITTVAAKLAALRQDVLVFHLVGRVELDGDWHGVLTFEELETGRRVEVDADAARPAYLAALEREHQALKQRLEERGVTYARFALDQPLDLALRRFLSARERMR